MKALIGLRVKEKELQGHIAFADGDELWLEWFDRDALTPRITERFVVSRDRVRADQIDVLSLTDGWMKMSNMFPKNAGTARYQDLIEDIERLISDSAPSRTLAEAGEKKPKNTGAELEKKAREKRKARAKKGGGHNPFKTKTKLGPGPRNGTNSQTHKWRCKCSTPYKCLCKAGKLRKTIRIKRSYKQPYNHEYKKWRRNQRH